MEETLCNGINVFRWQDQIELSFRYHGNASKAVHRRLKKFARKLGLTVCTAYPYNTEWCTCILRSRKDQHRADELVKFAGGKSMSRTAANNCDKFTM